MWGARNRRFVEAVRVAIDYPGVIAVWGFPRGSYEIAGEADHEYAMIDATIIRAHQHAAGAKGGTQRQNAWAAPEGA